MANNIDFITSIRHEHDFEEVVRRVAKYIYDAEAYLCGGPYDGGRDLNYKVQGVEVKEAVQISIQRTSIEAKILEDAQKTLKLVEEHGYPKKLTFFWNQTLSASKKLTIKKEIRNSTGVSLELYDASELEQIITNDVPEILTYLLEDIHGHRVTAPATLDAKARTFYDYLALSKDATEFKSHILDAEILSILLGTPMSRDELFLTLEKSQEKKGPITSRLGYLVNNGRVINVEGMLSLSEREQIRINAIVGRDELLRKELLEKLKAYSEESIGYDLSVEALELIKKVYSASVEIQISEIAFDPPKLSIAKNIVRDIEGLIRSKKKLTETNAKEIARNLIGIASENEYLSNYCSSALCVNLLKQRKLEKYIKEKNFFIYLDATVFIRYLTLFRFKSSVSAEIESQVTSSLKSTVAELKNVKTFITREHLEESIRHITQAEKIASFANDDLIQKFGDSKNVYFNLYLKVRADRRKPYDFDRFLEELIGYEKNGQDYHTKFNAYMLCAQRFLTIADIAVAEYPYSDGLEEDPSAKRIFKSYESYTSRIRKSRKFRSVKNDLIACYILADTHRHVDSSGAGHTPILITWDSTQHDLRRFYREVHPFSEWIIYSPQRAIERFSMLDFKMDGDILKDNVMAILDEDYIKDSSIIDTLAVFLGEDKIESDSIISLLSKLSNRTHSESKEQNDLDVESKNSVNEILIFLQNRFRNRFADLRRIFASPSYEVVLVRLLTSFIEGKADKEKLAEELESLANEKI